MTSDSDLKILKILFFIVSFILFFCIGFVLTLFIMVDKVYAEQQVPITCTIAWQKNASETESVNCFNTEPNIGGYTTFFNLWQLYNNNYGSQTWHFTTLIDLYVIDYGNKDGDFIQTPNIGFADSNGSLTITNLSRTLDTQYVTCDDPNNCVRHRIFNISFDYTGVLNGSYAISFGSGNNRADCGWLMDNPSTCSSSYPRVHWLSTTASYSDGGRFDDISQDLNDQTTILNGAINDSTSSINSNNNTNTQTIINNNNSNTQSIINNQKELLGTCNTYNIYNGTISSRTVNGITSSADIFTLTINGTPTVGHRILFGKAYLEPGTYTFSLSLSRGTITRDVSFYLYSGNANEPSWSVFITIPVTTNVGDVVSRTFTIQSGMYIYLAPFIYPNQTFTNAEFKYTLTEGTTFKGFYGYNIETCISKLDNLESSVDSVNNSITDSSVSVGDSDFDEMNSNIATNSVISDLLLLPVSLFQSILNSVNGACSSFSLGSLFGSNLTMPCIDVQSYLGSALYSVIDVLISGFFILSIRKKFVDIFNHITSLKDGGNELE